MISFDFLLIEFLLTILFVIWRYDVRTSDARFEFQQSEDCLKTWWLEEFGVRSTRTCVCTV